MSEEQEGREHEASEQKLRRAREQGDIPRAPDVGVALSYLSFWLVIPAVIALALPGWLAMGARLLGGEPWPERGAGDLAMALANRSALVTLGMLAVPAVLVLMGSVIQRALVFTPSKILPDLKRINPLKNAAQKFGRTGLMGFLSSLAKVGLVAGGGWVLFGRLRDRIASSGDGSGTLWLLGLDDILRQVLALALMIAVVFGAFDLFWKRLEYLRRNRMTRQEVQDEYKESEGDPHLRQARRQRAVDLALGSMLADVEKADVVIVNPTHYAVALEWKRGSGRAPVCVAKGVDEVAARIRQRARDHGVPIFSDPPSARALHATVKIGEEITREHFGPVAAAIRFAEVMRTKARKGWGGPIPVPPKPARRPDRKPRR